MKLIPLGIGWEIVVSFIFEFDYDMKTMIGGNGIDGFLFRFYFTLAFFPLWF